MPKKKPEMPATVASARATVTDEARNHARYELEYAAEADAFGDTEKGVDVARMKRVLPVRGLEAILKDLTPDLIHAANLYHADLMTAEGVRSSAIQERVDTSGDPTAQANFLADCRIRLGRVRGKIGGTADLVIELERMQEAAKDPKNKGLDFKRQQKRILKDIQARKARIAIIDKLFSERPHDRMTAIYGKGRPYQRAKEAAREALVRLSVVYGLRSDGDEG